MWVFNSLVLRCEPQPEDWGLPWSCLSHLSSGIRDVPWYPGEAAAGMSRWRWGTSAGLSVPKASKSRQLPQSRTLLFMPSLQEIKPGVAQPWGILSAGLPWKQGPSRLASTEGALTDSTSLKAFTYAYGTAPLFPRQRPIMYGNGNKCLLRCWLSLMCR